MKMVEKWRLFSRKRRLTIFGVVAIIASVGVVYAATTLFTHTFPAVTVPGVSALVTTTCPGSTLGVTNPPGASGELVFLCQTVGGPFEFSTGTAAVAVSATGGLPSGYTDLYAIVCQTASGVACPPSGSQNTCASITQYGTPVVLFASNPSPSTNGLTITATSGTGLAASTSYEYCADYTNTSTSPLTLSSFTVTWQQ